MRLLTAFLAAFVLTACPAAEESPPLFNAKDLSVQCNTGEVGWDFSTGGNDTSVVERSVSREITVESALLGTCDYKNDFAVDCDGKRECTRQVKKSTSPTCTGGALNLVYRCGTETAKYNLVIATDASSQSVNLACGEPLTIVSAIYGSNAPTAANRTDITTAVASACTGKRRCALADPYEINSFTDPWPNNSKDTLVTYYCGIEPTTRSSVVPSGQRVDIQCPLADAPVSVVKERLRIKGVSCSTSTCDATDQQRVRDWDTKVREQCEGKEQCRLRMEQFVPKTTRGTALRVEYWCTSPEASESRSFYSNSVYEPYFDLFCGTDIRIVRANGNGADLAATRAACDYKSRCVLPAPFAPADGGLGTPGPGGIGSLTAAYEYTCGPNAFDVRTTQTLTANTTRSNGVVKVTNINEMDRQISCDRATNNLVGGIRILTANYEGADQLIDATKQCYGRDVCTILANGTSSATYRCGNSYEIKTAIAKPYLPSGLMMSCRPDVQVTSFECDNTDPTERRCPDNTGRRFITTATTSLCYAGNNGVCDISKGKGAVAHIKWTCGRDTKVYSYDGPGEPEPTGPAQGTDSFYDFLRPRCEVPTTPYESKACVKEVCAANQRRDSKLNCIPDATKTPTIFVSQPIVKEWAASADGGISQFGGAVATDLKEDFPYQVFASTLYTTQRLVPISPTTAVTVWAYDEFAANAGVTTAATAYGFRCVVAEAPIRDAEYPSSIANTRWVVNGGKGGVLPLSCFRQDVQDGRNAWADAARTLKITESELRRNYTRKTSWLATSVDATGRTVARVINGQYTNAPNPVGFFYDSTNGWIDQRSFYLQTADNVNRKQVKFIDSNEIQLAAMNTTLRDAVIKLDVSRSDMLPTFNVDFTWSQRGDSAARNPLSPNSMLTANDATPLNKRNLRATLEIARQAPAGETTWTAVNATSFPSVSLGRGNAMSQTARMSGVVTPSLRERMLSVKGTDANYNQTADGFMRGFEEDNTAFRVRVCLDFDDVTHGLTTTDATDTVLDGKGVTADRDSVTYGLKITKRCTESAVLLLQRELFTYPAVPVNTTESNANSASSPRQGDSTAASTNDMGNQNGCSEASGKQSCSGQSRNSMTTGGQFSLSAFESNETDESAQNDTVKTTKVSTDMKLFGFKVFDLSGGNGAEPQSAGAWQVQIDLAPNLGAIAELWKSRRSVGAKTDAKTKKTSPKSKKGKGPSAASKFFGKFERDGLAVSLSKEFPFTLGPFPFVLEVGFSAGFGFGIGLRLSGDYQSTTSMVNPKYPCLKTSAGRCVVAYGTETKTWNDAREACRLLGGQLAEIRTAADLTAVTDAVSMVGAANSAFWIGAQAAYQYQDSRCQTSLDARCAGISRTRYVWLTGNTPFANQLRTDPALVNPASLTGNHGFGTNLGFSNASKAPVQSAVLYRKDTSNLAASEVTATAPYLCAFDPASSYIEASIGIEMKVEFAVGFEAKICTPSSDIGFCLGVGINLITAGVNVSADRSRIMVFNNSKIKVTLLGESRVEGTWEVAFLAGSFNAEINYLVGSASWEIASYKGIYALEGDLFPAIVTPYARTYP